MVEDSPNIIYASVMVDGSSEMYRTLDGGENWRQLADVPKEIQGPVNQINILQPTPDTLFISSTYDSTVYQSKNGGSSWQKTPIFKQSESIVFQDSDYLKLTVSIRQTGLFQLHYVPPNDSLTLNTIETPDSIKVISDYARGWLIDECAEGRFLATKQGFYGHKWMECASNKRITSKGMWKPSNEGLPHLQIDEMDIVRRELIFLRLDSTSAGNGIYVRPITSTLTSTKSHSSDLPHEVNLFPNYPNPFNPKTRIKFSLPQPAEVQLTIYNTLGRKVATLVNGKKKAGQHAVTFDASNLSSGVYIYQLKVEDVTESKKMLMVK